MKNHDLHFIEKLACAGTLQYCMSEEQNNTKIRDINEFYKDINITL